MKYLWMMFVPVLTFHAVAAEFHISAPVVAAKLYTQEAEVLRKAEIQVDEAGKHHIWITPALSHDTADISVQIEGAKLVGQVMRPLFTGVEQDPLWQKNDEAERALALTKQALSDNRSLADALTKQGKNPAVNINELQKQLTMLNQARARLLEQKQKQTAALQALQLQAKWQGKDRQTLPQAIVFDIDALTPGKVVLTVQEHTNQAFWQPYSEFKLDTLSGNIMLRAEAQIVQNTGTDWKNAELTLALTPPFYEERPTLQSVTVAVADKVTAALNDSGVSRKSRAEAAVMPLTAMAMPQNANYSAIVSNGLDFEVLLPGQYHLDTGGQRYRLTYMEERIPATVYSAVYAWANRDPLLIGHWTLPSGKGFIPGNTTIYRDGNRLASLYLNRIVSGGSEQTLSFGKDPQLETDYRTPPGYTAGSGIIIKDRVLEQRETIQVKNLSDIEKEVRIYTRVPVATQNEVRVDPVFKPQPNEKNAENVQGISLWQKRLSPGESMSVESGYDIRYPEGKRLIGIE